MALRKLKEVEYDPAMYRKIFLYGAAGINIIKEVIFKKTITKKNLLITPEKMLNELVGLKNLEVWTYSDMPDIDDAISAVTEQRFDMVVLHDLSELNDIIYNYITKRNEENASAARSSMQSRMDKTDWTAIEVMTKDRMNVLEKCADVYIVTARETMLKNTSGDVIGVSPYLIGSLREKFALDFPEVFRVARSRVNGKDECIIRTRPTVGISSVRDTSGTLAEYETDLQAILTKIEGGGGK